MLQNPMLALLLLFYMYSINLEIFEVARHEKHGFELSLLKVDQESNELVSPALVCNHCSTFDESTMYKEYIMLWGIL